MSTRKPSPQSRSLRPTAEPLEGRQLLSALLTGTDPNGNKWTLRLIGPGTMNVSDAKGNPFTNDTANTPDAIDTITVSGTDSVLSRLVGTVVPNNQGKDPRVFFQFLNETGGGELPQVDPTTPIGNLNPEQPKNGLLSIVMPDFWLGNTRGTIPTASPSLTGTSTADVGSINIPDGVSTLNFGGVDTTFTPAGGSPLNQDNQNDRFTVNLGTPYILGTSIIINRSITDAQAGQPNSTTGTTGSPTQDSVYFTVAGRLNLFQANEIDGNTQFPPDQFTATAGSTSTTPGGTFVISGTGTPPFFIGSGGTTGALTGQIGFMRIGGNATNLTAMVYDNANPNLDARITNFSVGGETNHVLVVAPQGLRNAFFGKGMDTVQIDAQEIDSIEANRGALNSTVTSSRGVNNLVIGGDVVNTDVQSGYDLSNFLPFIQNTAVSGAPIPTITNRFTATGGALLPRTQNAGHINTRIAGDVVNSIFSASIEPNPSANANVAPGTFSEPVGHIFPFGEPDNIVYPRGIINAKVEGTIDNTNNTLVAAKDAHQAFFAQTVNLTTGPVVPPNVPEAPYPETVYHRGQRGVPPVQINPLVVHPGGPLKKTSGTSSSAGGTSSGNG